MLLLYFFKDILQQVFSGNAIAAPDCCNNLPLADRGALVDVAYTFRIYTSESRTRLSPKQKEPCACQQADA